MPDWKKEGHGRRESLWKEITYPQGVGLVVFLLGRGRLQKVVVEGVFVNMVLIRIPLLEGGNVVAAPFPYFDNDS